MSKPFKYVDLFAGCGGLSLGLEQAGFELALAVEKSDMAAETFYHNFVERITDQADWKDFSSKDTGVLEQAKRKLVVKELGDVLDCKELLDKLKKEGIDLVAGGPPCQGFSLAGRRNPEDIRNKLPWQFLEFVEAVHPKAVIIENVSGMSQDFKKHGKESPFDQLRLALQQTGPGYEVQPVLLNAMHFGAPQHRPRVMLLGLRKDIAKGLGFVFSEHTWRSDYDQVGSMLFPQRPSLAPTATHFGEDILTVADAIADLNRKGYSKKANITEYAKEMREDDDWMPEKVKATRMAGKLANHALRKHADHIETRFRIYQYFREEGIPPKVMGIPKTPGIPDDGLKVMVSEAIQSARLPAKAPDGTVIAKSKAELVDLIMTLGTKKHSQRPLNWKSPSPTVVSLPDDYVHPEDPRTLTVREMARFQSFPDSFEFRAKETTGSLRRRFEVPQYTQVGNAVPPKMARAVGLSLRSALEAVIASQRKKAS
jgi:DNA (cytosine-5)-methyltransferase 1